MNSTTDARAAINVGARQMCANHWRRCAVPLHLHLHHWNLSPSNSHVWEVRPTDLATLARVAEQRPHGDAFPRHSAQRHAAPTTSIWGLIISKGDQDRR